MANLRDFTGKNRRFTGTTGIISSDTDGTSAQRVNEKGRLRFNNTLGLMEYYNGTTWIAIDAPPSISSLTPDTINIPDSGTTVSLQINGSNFSVGATGAIFNASGTEINFATFSRVSDTRIDATITVADLGTIDDPYDVKVTNASGLANTLAAGLNFNEKPTWNTAAGSLGTIVNTSTGTHFTLSATDPEGGNVDYRIRTGSLPAGLSLDSSNGAISGDPTDVNSSTTSNFTVAAFDDGSAETARGFSITVSPVPSGGTITSYSNYTVHSFTSTGSTNFVNDFTISNADILVVGGGGAGGSQGTSETGGGGGAGGFRTATGVTIPAGTHSVTVGAGGTGVGGTGGDGGDTSFGTLLAATGGGGGAQQETNGRPGGSGGGAGGIDSGTPTNDGGSGNAGGYTPSEGNPGGDNNNGVGDMGAGGGGASNAGEGINTGPRGGGAGGNGANNDFRTGSNVTYAGGGGGGMNTNSTRGAGGNGGGGRGNPGGSGNGENATDGLGGGGGGGTGPGTNGGDGGNGIAVVRFELP